MKDIVHKKLVNITSKVAIRTVTPKICGTHKNVLMSVGDILRCICMRARVEEILPDGTTIILDSNNYNKDNSSKIIVSDTLNTDEIITDDVEDESEEVVSGQVDVETDYPQNTKSNKNKNNKKNKKKH